MSNNEYQMNLNWYLVNFI